MHCTLIGWLATCMISDEYRRPFSDASYRARDGQKLPLEESCRELREDSQASLTNILNGEVHGKSVVPVNITTQAANSSHIVATRGVLGRRYNACNV
jgi:hypothetical protein